MLFYSYKYLLLFFVIFLSLSTLYYYHLFLQYYFLESMILYPVDSLVTLSNGELARVVKNNPNYILRPTVVSVESGKVYDLGDDISCASIIIVS